MLVRLEEDHNSVIMPYVIRRTQPDELIVGTPSNYGQAYEIPDDTIAQYVEALKAFEAAERKLCDAMDVCEGRSMIVKRREEAG